MKQRYLLLAPRWQFYKEWCRQREIDTREVRWVHSEERIMGISPEGWIVAVTGAYGELEHLHGLWKLARIVDRLNARGFEWESEADKEFLHDWIVETATIYREQLKEEEDE
jgi:hypothetical protein